MGLVIELKQSFGIMMWHGLGIRLGLELSMELGWV